MNTASIVAGNLQLAGELLRLADALDARAVPFVVLKGLPLADRLFGRMDRRALHDNDILVRRRDVVRALDACRDAGYERRWPQRSLEQQLLINNQEPLVRRFGAGRLTIAELHWDAFTPVVLSVDEEVQWARVRPVAFMGRGLLAFDEAMTLLHLAVHFAMHGFRERRILQEVAAAWNAWHATIDVADLCRLGRETGLDHFLAFALRSADELGWLPVPPPALGSRRAAFLRAALPPRRLFRRPLGRGYWRQGLTFVLAGLGRLPARIRADVFPPIGHMAVIYDRPVSKALYLRYLTRPLRPLRRVLRGLTTPARRRRHDCGGTRIVA